MKTKQKISTVYEAVEWLQRRIKHYKSFRDYAHKYYSYTSDDYKKADAAHQAYRNIEEDLKELLGLTSDTPDLIKTSSKMRSLLEEAEILLGDSKDPSYKSLVAEIRGLFAMLDSDKQLKELMNYSSKLISN